MSDLEKAIQRMNREAGLLQAVNEDLVRAERAVKTLQAKRISARQSHLDAQLIVQQIQIRESHAA